MNVLRPKFDDRTFLISSTTKFDLFYDSDNIRIFRAFPADLPDEVGENPYYRSFYSVSYVNKLEFIDEIASDPSRIQIDEAICTCLAVLFGKRVENKGFMIRIANYQVPSPENYQPIWLYRAGPYNHSPRNDIDVPLDLKFFKLIAGTLEPRLTSSRPIITFLTAGKFYCRALINLEEFPESAFVDLISCGEILAQYFDYTEDQLYDSDLKAAFDNICKILPTNDKNIKILKDRIKQVTKRFTLTIISLLNVHFFVGPRNEGEGPLLIQEGLEKRIKAAYDLRSKYLHAGYQFAFWLRPHREALNEIHGRPPILEETDEQKELAKSIERCPTLLGLERIMRFCLLRFIQKYGGIHIDDRLADDQ